MARKKNIEQTDKKYAFAVGTITGGPTNKYVGPPKILETPTSPIEKSMNVRIAGFEIVEFDDRFIVDNASQAYFCFTLMDSHLRKQNSTLKLFLVEI